jgi:sulfite exporter TauE/SafE
VNWTEALVPGFLFGIANSAHCAGMCGIFAFQAGGGAAGAGSAWRLPLYVAGKTFTYLFLGGLAGLAGAQVIRGATNVQAAVGVAVGLVLVLTAWRLLRPAKAPGRLAIWWSNLVAPFFKGVRVAHDTGGPFALGAMTGALPCGVVYLAALQAAALGSPVRSMALMAAFGLGTAPVLVVAGLLGRGALARLGPVKLRVAGAILVLATGLVAVARSAPTLLAGDGTPACCYR